MTDSLEQQFDAQAMAVYENGKRVLGYNGTRFLQKIRADGGVAAAKSWLKPKKKDKPTNGFLKLVDYGRLDLSLEAVVLADPWNTLFTESELLVADQRLRKYGYFIDPVESTDRSNLIPQEIGDELFREGSVSTVVVNKYERNAAARDACIAHYGAKCRVCDFDFAEHYGADFTNFIHVHHLCPLASIGTEYEINPIADLRPVCPNCHAVIHSKNPCYTIEATRQLIANNAT